jgi:hypothetical protein
MSLVGKPKDAAKPVAKSAPVDLEIDEDMPF